MNAKIEGSSEFAALIAKVREYESAGRPEIALLILEGGVIRYPDDLAVLEEYVFLARSVGDRFDIDARIQQLTNLASLIQSRIPFIKLDNLDRIVELADTAVHDASKYQSANEQGPQFSELELEYFEAARGGALNLLEATATEGRSLSDIADSLEKVMEHFSSDESDAEIAGLIRQNLNHIRFSEQFDMALAEADQLMKQVSTSDESFTGYLLQQIDQILRNLVIQSSAVAEWRRKKLAIEVRRLNELSEMAAVSFKNREAAARFQAMEILLRKEIEELKALPEPSNEGFHDGALQRKLSGLQKPMQRLVELSSIFSGTEYGQKIGVKITELQSLASKWSQQQQKRYDQWALSKIRQGYADGVKHVRKVGFDDEPKLAESLIESFGGIDLRLVGPEVQRTYSEVFELLYERLNSPSRDETKDYKDKGGKLYALKAMMDQRKISLSEF